MTEERFSIVITRYRDAEGNPTCAADFPSGKVCTFYQTQRFGCNETCVFARDNGKYRATLRRRNNGDGTLIPLDDCPAWPQP